MCTDYHPCQEQILGIYNMSHSKNFPSDEKHSKRNEISLIILQEFPLEKVYIIHNIKY
jgi:hypothetical protein